MSLVELKFLFPLLVELGKFIAVISVVLATALELTVRGLRRLRGVLHHSTVTTPPRDARERHTAS